MTDITCRFIVQKGNEFFVANANCQTGTDRYRPVLSPYVYDAKHFRNNQQAQEIAKDIRGRVRIFDKLNGELI